MFKHIPSEKMEEVLLRLVRCFLLMDAYVSENENDEGLAYAADSLQEILILLVGKDNAIKLIDTGRKELDRQLVADC